MFTVRPARPSDSVVIETLRRMAEAEAIRYRGHIDPDGRKTDCAVVEIAGEVVGGAAYADENGIRLITFIHVHEDARNVGAGDALMGWLLDDARDKNCVSVRSTTLPGDRATKNLFERNGLVARAIQVERKLA